MTKLEIKDKGLKELLEIKNKLKMTPKSLIEKERGDRIRGYQLAMVDFEKKLYERAKKEFEDKLQKVREKLKKLNEKTFLAYGHGTISYIQLAERIRKNIERVLRK